MKIRRTIESDVGPLSAIVRANYSKRFAEAFVSEVACHFSTYPFKPHFFTAVDDALDTIIGLGCWTTDWCSWGCVNLSWVGVDPKWQRRGIGTAIVDQLLNEVRPLASLVLIATTSPEFYSARWGFRRYTGFPAGEGGEHYLMGLVLT